MGHEPVLVSFFVYGCFSRTDGMRKALDALKNTRPRAGRPHGDHHDVRGWSRATPMSGAIEGAE